MNTTAAPASDMVSPLPTRQFRSFLLFFHATIFVMLAVACFQYVRWHEEQGGSRPGSVVFVSLAVLQAAIYLWFFAVPSLTERWPRLFWWWASYLLSIGIVLFQTSQSRGFAWFIIVYLGIVSGMPLRISVPVFVVVIPCLALAAFGWSNLSHFSAGEWGQMVLSGAAMVALLLFLGRTVATSAERGKLVVELERARSALELAREREIELAKLRERERLARDLHDNLGHALTTLTVQLEAVQRLQSKDPGRADALLTELQKLTRSSMEDLRRSLADLRTPGLGDRPLADALRSLCSESAARLGIRVECDLAPDADSLPSVVAEALWRVVQEGLTNIEKHAHARRVEVSLALPTGEVVLRVRDDGAGVPPGAEDKPGHFGLRGLRERLEGLGGALTTARSHPGTLLEARVPHLG